MRRASEALSSNLVRRRLDIECRPAWALVRAAARSARLASMGLRRIGGAPLPVGTSRVHALWPTTGRTLVLRHATARCSLEVGVRAQRGEHAGDVRRGRGTDAAGARSCAPPYAARCQAAGRELTQGGRLASVARVHICACGSPIAANGRSRCAVLQLKPRLSLGARELDAWSVPCRARRRGRAGERMEALTSARSRTEAIIGRAADDRGCLEASSR